MLIEGDGWGHTRAGVPCASPGTDRGLCCTSSLGHGGAAGSSQGAGCVPQALTAPSWDRGAGAGDGRVSAPAAPGGSAPPSCHRTPPASLHRHPHSPSPPPQGVPLDGPKARPLFGWGQPLPRSALGSKPMFFPCAVLHQPGNPQENRTSRAKELLPYTSSPHSVPGKVGRTGQ